MRTREEIQNDIDAVMSGCELYRSCKDGSHGACLHANGYGELKKEMEELKERDNELH